MEIEFKKGQTLFAKGDEADAFYLVKSGSVELFDPESQVSVEVIEPGCTFGEQAIFAYGIRNLSAKAKEDSICLKYASADLHRLLPDQPATARRAFEMIILELEMKNTLRAAGAGDKL